MKKNTFLITLFLSFMMTWSYAQVQIGAGNIKTNAPIDLRYDSTYSQSIYLGAEINATGTVTSIQWYYDNNYQTSADQITDIYIGNTTKSQFDNYSDWVPAGNLTKVFSGRFVTNGTKGWKTIVLTTPFVYDGSSNLVVAANSRNNSEASHAPFDGIYYFSSTVYSGNRTLTAQTDGKSYDPATPPGFAFESFKVPNIIFGGISQGCPRANGITSSNITTDSATITWLPSTPTPSLGSEYYYSTSNTDPNGGTLPKGSVTSGVTANLTELLPGTTYYVWVRNKCGTDTYSSWSTIATFTTVCLDVDYFFENFDEVTTPKLPNCWSKILRGPGLKSNSVVSTFKLGNAISPQNIVELFASDSPNTADIMLVSPSLSNLGNGTNRLKFYAKGMAKEIVIGTLDNNTNTAVFTPYQTIAINPSWGQYEVDFKDYRGSNKYIAIRTNFNPDFDVTFADLDNILWEPNPACIDAKGLYVPDTTPDSATVKWDQIGAPEYQIVYGISTDNFPYGLTPLAPTNLTQENLTGLTANTTYRVWLRTVCANNEYGAWSEPVNFTTPCEAEPEVGFYENFNNVVVPNLPNCWSKIIRGATVSTFARVETDEYSNILPQPNISALLYNDESPDYENDDVILVTPKLSTLQLGTYRLRFVAKHLGSPTGLEIGTLNNNTNFATFNVIQTNDLTDQTKEYVVDFNVYTGSDTFIGIRLKASSWYTTVEIDNIVWEISPSCPDVTDINVVSTTPNSVTVGWTDGGSSESFDVAVIAPNDTDPGSSAYTNTTENPTEITGLSANTTYSIWIRSVCAGNDLGRWIGPVDFTTACDQVAVFYEDFESSDIPELPNCWSKILRGNSLSPQANVETTYSYLPEETKAVLLKNLESNSSDDVILVTPNLSTLSTGAYRLKFLAKGDNVAELQFGTLNSNLNNATFTSINQNIIPSATTTEYIINFDGDYGTDTFIGIRTVSQYTYVELDNITWEPIPPCPDVKNVTLDGTTKTTATVYWDAGNATNWEVAVGSITDTDPNSIIPITTNIPAIEISDLSVGTCYNVWVRSVCDVSLGNGYWSKPIQICTQCTATNVPYTQNFESSTPPKLPLCTSAVNLSAGSANWYVENNPGYGFNSNTLTYNSDLYADANAWFFTQGINLESGKNYTISYRYGGASNDTEYYNNSLKVMYGKEAGQSFMTLPIADYPFFATDTPIAQSINFTPPSTDVYYFGFNVYSPNNSNYMFIDDIIIDNQLSNNQFDVSNFNYYPNPVKDVLNISYVDNITAVKVYNLLGQEVITKSINGNLASIDMSALAKGTYMVKITSNQLVKTVKVIKE